MASLALLLVFMATSALALDVKWTPASDGGPARFSKKYRDAQGIDDSRWTNEDDDDSSGLSLFPTTPGGWVLAAIAGFVIFVMLGQRAPQVWQTGQTVGGGAPAGRGGSSANDAARAAFLKKYGQAD